MDRTNFRAEVRIFPDAEATCAALAAALAELAAPCLTSGSRLCLALSGGTTPRRLYQRLAGAYHDRLPWNRLHFFFGDDRFVPHEDTTSNYRMAREALFDAAPIPQGNIHPMPTFFQDPAAGAAEYEATLREHFHGPWPRFDVMLQGLGTEGHTASLFPHSPALRQHDRWVLAVETPATPSRRLTVTLPVLNHAARVWFLVTGSDKAEIVARVLGGDADPEECPAAGVCPEHGELVFWLDEAAAAALPENQPRSSAPATP